MEDLGFIKTVECLQNVSKLALIKLKLKIKSKLAIKVITATDT